MSDTSNNLSYMCLLPTELLLNIFYHLPAKDLWKVRGVCARWLTIINEITELDDLWRTFCIRDFGAKFTLKARSKQKAGLNYFHLYRSLSLWNRLSDANESRDEFAAASRMYEEIRNFVILDKNVLGVHKKGAVVYYDMETLKEGKRESITGDYSRYIENDVAIVIQSYHLELYLIKKAIFDITLDDSNTTFSNGKLFYLTDDTLYFVTLADEIYMCNYYKRQLKAHYITRSEDGIMSLGYTNKQLNVLTFHRKIYTIVNNEMVFVCALGPDSNLLHQLKEYNFLEQLDWRIYFQWMYVLNHSIPDDGLLRDIIIIRPYGDVYFVGSNWGVLRIYYAPYADGELDIFHTAPVKQYNFMERSDCPVLSTCQILQIDVSEIEDGHLVIVAMPKKIATLKFTHTFNSGPELALVPYRIPQIKL
ncbi:uncharacterized protein LOC118281014 [Spodoptera frugiperda]|uniref:Uncharacterized protein LOC118281014 n=1 Tax=Spodoptera frugiperda TaxID=7108 RepID=A0A9R0DJW7_SPOFR|nr:uncharacterized protein LOC118281014 [Spodoptera frugiperda]